MDRRLSNHTIYSLLLVAGFFDLIGSIPFLNIPIDILGWATFWIWFIRLGISWKSPKKLAAPGLSILIELIPVLSAIPTFLLAIGTNIAIIIYEDYQKSINSKNTKISQKFSVLEKHYSPKQIISRPKATPEISNLGKNQPLKPTTLDQYGLSDYDNNKNFQISDVKAKSSKTTSPQNRRAA